MPTITESELTSPAMSGKKLTCAIHLPNAQPPTNPSEPADHHRARQTKTCLPRIRLKPSPRSQRQSQRRSEAERVGHQLRKVGASRIEHTHRRHPAHQHGKDASGNRQPQNESVAEAPEQTRTRADGAPRG